MKLKSIYFISLLFIVSCNKYDGPYYEPVQNYFFTKTGEGQKTLADNYFNDSVGISVSNYSPDYSVNGMTAHFTIVAGGGTLDQQVVDLQNGIAKTKWKSGIASCRQQVRIDIYDKENKFLHNVNLEAFALRKNTWDTITTQPDNYIQDILADTISGKTFMVAYNGIYTQKDNYFTWEQQTPQMYTPFSLHKDANGTIYMSTWNGLIYKSTDSGTFWTLCTKPIPNHIYYYYMTVSNDGYLWASSPDYKKSLRCSRDGGNTWSADTIGLMNYELANDFYRLKNGNILFFSSQLYKSTDDGKSWKTMDCPQYSHKLFVTEKEEMIIFNQDEGISIYKSTDLGQTYRKVHSVWPQYVTTMAKIIQKKGNYYYILIPGYGIIRTPDFESFELFWRNTEIVYLYQTHDGVLVAKGFSNDKVYYYRD